MAKQKENNQQVGQVDENLIASVVINGDLSKLTQEQKVQYYRMYCQRVGLDPISQPFKLLKLNGKEIMYCDRTGAQQLNKIHAVSHEIRARETVNGCYVVTAQATTPDNRRTESIGAVSIDNLRGDSLCNAMMKAETKAKRRATLDLLGLGILDESEALDLPGAEPQTMDIPHQEVKVPAAKEEQAAPPASAQPAAQQPAQQPNTEPAAKVENPRTLHDPFNHKYTDQRALLAALTMINSTDQLKNLYIANQATITATPEVQTAFDKAKMDLLNHIYSQKIEDPDRLANLMLQANHRSLITTLHFYNSFIIDRSAELFSLMNRRLAELADKK